MLEKKDLLILSQFRENARKNLTAISKQTKIPVSTLFKKLKKYEQTIITKHTAIIDFSKLGFNTMAKLLIKVDKSRRSELEQYLLKHQNVNSVSKIIGSYDFAVEAIFSSIQNLEMFIDSIDERFGIKKKEIFYIVDDIKREGFLADNNLIELYMA